MGAWPAATRKVRVRDWRPPLRYVGFKEKRIIGNTAIRGKQQHPTKEYHDLCWVSQSVILFFCYTLFRPPHEEGQTDNYQTKLKKANGKCQFDLQPSKTLAMVGSTFEWNYVIWDRPQIIWWLSRFCRHWARLKCMTADCRHWHWSAFYFVTTCKVKQQIFKLQPQFLFMQRYKKTPWSYICFFLI